MPRLNSSDVFLITLAVAVVVVVALKQDDLHRWLQNAIAQGPTTLDPDPQAYP